MWLVEGEGMGGPQGKAENGARKQHIGNIKVLILSYFLSCVVGS